MFVLQMGAAILFSLRSGIFKHYSIFKNEAEKKNPAEYNYILVLQMFVGLHM